MRILIVGAGGVGSAAARIAVRRGFFEKLVLADYDPKRPQAIVDELGDDRLAAAQVDASSAESVASLIREHGATHVLNAVDPRFVMPIFDGCFAAGATYLDMAMSLSYPHPEQPYALTGVKLGDDQFAKEQEWKDAGLLALVGIGVEPGLSDVFARYAEDELFSEIDELGVRDGSNLVVAGYDFAPAFSIWATIEECLNPPIIYEEGKGWFTTAPFSEPEVFDFPDGIGPIKCVNVEHEEVLLMPRWTNAKRVTFKFGLSDEFIQVLQVLHKTGARPHRQDQREGRRGLAARRRRGGPARPRDARRQDDRQDVRRRVGDRQGQGRAAAFDVPVPRRRQRGHDARVQLAGGRLADGDQPRRRARAARRGDVVGHRDPRP